MAGRYLCETCFDQMTNHVVDMDGFEEAICDDCIRCPTMEQQLLDGFSRKVRDLLARWSLEQQHGLSREVSPYTSLAKKLYEAAMARCVFVGYCSTEEREEVLQLENGSIILFKPGQSGSGKFRGCGERGQTGERWEDWLLGPGQPLG